MSFSIIINFKYSKYELTHIMVSALRYNILQDQHPCNMMFFEENVLYKLQKRKGMCDSYCLQHTGYSEQG